MLFHSLLGCLTPHPNSQRCGRVTPRSMIFRPAVESLEDRRTPAAVFTIGDAEILEGNDGTQSALVTVSLTEPHGNNVAVNFSTVAGSAAVGSDFTAVSGKLTFTKSQMSKQIVVPIIGDRLVETDEYFSVRLSNAKGSRIGDGIGDVRLVDNEPYVYVSSAYATEGNERTAPAVFTISLTRTYDRAVTVNYATADSSALAGVDYTVAEGSVTIAAGDLSVQLPIAVHGDRLGEQSESFVLNVSTPDSYAQMGNTTAYATITDNEPQITIWDVYNYGESTMTFTVTLSVPYDELVTVDFTTMDGTATAGLDYVATAGTLEFEEDETYKTITIEVLDPTSMPDKYFLVHLSGATTNALLATEWAYGWWYYDYGYYDYGWGYYDYGYYDYGYYY